MPRSASRSPTASGGHTPASSPARCCARRSRRHRRTRHRQARRRSAEVVTPQTIRSHAPATDHRRLRAVRQTRAARHARNAEAGNRANHRHRTPPTPCSSQGFDAAAKAKAAGLVQSFRDYLAQHQTRDRRAANPLQPPVSNSASPNRCSRNWKRNCATTTPRGPKTASGTPSPSPRRPRSKAARRPDALPISSPLVRFALEQQPVLAPFADSVAERFNEWLMDKAEAGTSFSAEQLAWLESDSRPHRHGLSIEPEDLELLAVQSARRFGQSAPTFRRATAQAAR